MIRARLLSTLGRVYFDVGDMAPADSLLHQAEVLYEHHPGDDSLHFAETENALGTLELERSNLPATVDRYQRAITIYSQQKGAESSEVADLLDGLGVVEGQLDHLDSAADLLERSVRIHTRNFGPEAPPTLVDMHNLASIYGKLGDYRRQLALTNAVLLAHQRTIGDLQEITTSDLGNLAWVEDTLNHLARAEEVSREVIRNKGKLFGSDNPRLGLQYFVLADVFRKQGRTTEAKDAEAVALRMLSQFDGTTSLNYAYAVDERGLLVLQESRFDQAGTDFKEALRIREANSPQPLAQIALSYDHLGQLALATDNPIVAGQQLRHALDLSHKGLAHPTVDTAETETHMAQALFAQHLDSEACPFVKDAVAVARKMFEGEPHPVLLAAEATRAKAQCSP